MANFRLTVQIKDDDDDDDPRKLLQTTMNVADNLGRL